jgi:AraC family transcriptional regulator
MLGANWRTASYRAGHLGMTPPRATSTLRFRGRTTHETLHLHVPEARFEDIIRQYIADCAATPAA